MKINLYVLFIFLFFYTFIPVNVNAGGGRTVFGYISRGRINYSEANIVGQVFKTSPFNVDYSADEKVEFRIENPRDGDRCYTRNERTNDLGVIGGYCTAKQSGEILVYIYSFDKNDESSRVVVYFDPEPTPTYIPISTSTPVPIITGTEEVIISQPSSINEVIITVSPKQLPESYTKNFVGRNKYIGVFLILIVGGAILINQLIQKKKIDRLKEINLAEKSKLKLKKDLKN